MLKPQELLIALMARRVDESRRQSEEATLEIDLEPVSDWTYRSVSAGTGNFA